MRRVNVPVVAQSPFNYRVTDGAVAAVSLLVSVLAGVALVTSPALALLPIACFLSAFLLVDGRARIVFVLFGGLLILQRDEGLDTSKLAFLAVFGVAFVGAFLNVHSMRATPAYRLAKPLLVASIAFVGLATLSLAVAYTNDTPLVGAWLRDVAPQLLFASAPIFALDAQASLSRRRLVQLLVAAGTFAAFAFAVHWLNRRGIADLRASRIGLASHFVPAALFAYGMSAVLHGRRTKWLGVSGLVLALLLATGTRTNLVLLFAPIGIAVGARPHLLRRSMRLAILGPVAVAITLLLGAAVLRASDANAEYFENRVAIFRSSGTESDGSYVERLRQGRAAWTVFESNPLLGAGPGTIFEYETVDRRTYSAFLLDTPLTFPAKYGLIGLLVLAFIVSKYWSFTRSLLRRRDPTIAYFTLVGYLSVVAASAIFYSPFEDKGFGFGLILVLALALGEANRSSAAMGSDPSRIDNGLPEGIRTS